MSPDGASRTVWVVTAVDRTGDAGVEIKVLEVADEGARHDEIGMFTVVVANSLPARTEKRAPDPGIKLAEHDADGSDADFDKQPPMTYYYTHKADLGTYFDDKDDSDGIDFKKGNIIVSDPAHVIVRHVDLGGANIYFDVVQAGGHTSRQNFTITVYAEDKAGAVSEESVEIQYEWPAPRMWKYDVTQTARGGFQTRPVGLRKGVEHTLMISEYAADDTTLLRLTNTILASDASPMSELAAAVKEVNDARWKSTDSTADTATATFATPGLTAPTTPAAYPAVETGSGLAELSTYLSVTGSGAVKVVGGLMTAANALTDAAGTVSFMTEHTGTGTITFVVKAWYRKQTAATAAWHDITVTKRTLHLEVSHVGAGTTTYSQQ